MRTLKKFLGFFCIAECIAGFYFLYTMPSDTKFAVIATIIFFALMAFLLLKKPKNEKKNSPKQIDADILIENANPTNTSPQKQGRSSALRKSQMFFAVCCCLAICLIIAIIAIPTDSTTNTASMFARELQLNQEQKATMQDIFTQCGIGKITSVKSIQQAETQSSYWLTDNETEFYGKGGDYAIVVWVDNETKQINEIYFHDQNIYIDGKVIAPITQYYVNEEARNNYRVAAQLAIEPLLNYPKTAKFPASKGWKFEMVDGIVIAYSSVEAQNAFGVKGDLSFKIKFLDDDIIYLNLDGTEYIK